MYHNYCNYCRFVIILYPVHALYSLNNQLQCDTCIYSITTLSGCITMYTYKNSANLVCVVQVCWLPNDALNGILDECIQHNVIVLCMEITWLVWHTDTTTSLSTAQHYSYSNGRYNNRRTCHKMCKETINRRTIKTGPRILLYS